MIFWDINLSIEEIKSILRDESHIRFIRFASLLLSRTDRTKEIFSDYLDKVTFCKNWRKIKQEMQKDKWNDSMIDFWEKVYKGILNH